MENKMRAKMVVDSVTKYGGGQETLKFRAVSRNEYPEDGSDEDNTFAKFTPTASIEIAITNPDLHGKFLPNEKYYVDFSPADKEE